MLRLIEKVLVFLPVVLVLFSPGSSVAATGSAADNGVSMSCGTTKCTWQNAMAVPRTCSWTVIVNDDEENSYSGTASMQANGYTAQNYRSSGNFKDKLKLTLKCTGPSPVP